MNWYIVLFAIIAIALFVISNFYRLKYEIRREKNIEAFQNHQDNHHDNRQNMIIDEKIHLKFLTPIEASQYIRRDSSYIRAMNQPNLTARRCSSQDELFAKYQDAFETITPIEQTRANDAISEMLSRIRSRNPAYARYLKHWINKIVIAKGKNWLEAGMPHTLDNMIVLNASWFDQPRVNTFLHELIHIHQRHVPFEFDDLFRELGYINISGNISSIKGLDNVLTLSRNNPDGLDINWLWKSPDTTGNTWWIGALFFNAIPNSLLDVDNVALKLETGADGELYYLKQQPTKLSQFKEFNKFFGGDNANNYHPNEMTAKFAEYYGNDTLGIVSSDNPTIHSPGYQKYKKYMEKLMATYYI